MSKINFPKKKYSIIYADPPWDYKGCRQHNGEGGKDTGGADIHYMTATTKEMMTWPVQDIAEDNCLLFMWSSSPHLDQAIDLGKSWGFKWATVGFVWYKERTNPGYYTLSQCELCLIFKRGRIPKPRGARNIRQFLSSLREEHSKKPDEIRKRIELMFPSQEKIELFARQKNKGWDCWGNEI